MDLLQRLNELNQERKQILTQLVPEVEKMLKRLEFPPGVNSVGWTQYTPYFNDGDTCIFRVNCDIDYILINGEDAHDSEFRGRLNKTEYKINPLTGKYEKDVNLNYDEVLGDFANEFVDLINSLPEEVLEEAFGDHCQVTLHKGGEIKVDSCEHD